MTNQNSKLFILPLTVAFALLLAFGVIWAISKDDIVFPVAELGNCGSEQECRDYCDSPENMEPCLAFGEKHNLFSAEELAEAKKFLALGEVGPGGCSGVLECKNYCNNINNIDECLDFAEQHGFMDRGELEEARKVQAALAKGAQLPGGCRNKNECQAYCTDPNHMEECITFAEAAGFMTSDELAEAKKVLAAIKKGARPPPCMGKEECDAYCMQPDKFEECLTFAEAAGLIPPEELTQAKQALVAIKKGVKPPPCRGEAECDAYCAEHIEECIAFAQAAGMMTPEEAAMARKTGGKGPGGCKGEQECKAFCEDPTNQEECFNFAVEHGMMSEEDMQQMQESMMRMQEGLQQAPPEVRNCLVRKLGADKVAEIEAGTGTVSLHMGDLMGECFEMMGPAGGFEEGPGGEMMPPAGRMPAGFTGPGGCTTKEECMAYCQQHPQECAQFGGGPSGQPSFGNIQPPMPPEGMMPPSGEIKPLPEEYRQQYEQQYQQYQK